MRRPADDVAELRGEVLNRKERPFRQLVEGIRLFGRMHHLVRNGADALATGRVGRPFVLRRSEPGNFGEQHHHQRAHRKGAFQPLERIVGGEQLPKGPVDSPRVGVRHRRQRREAPEQRRRLARREAENRDTFLRDGDANAVMLEVLGEIDEMVRHAGAAHEKTAGREPIGAPGIAVVEPPLDAQFDFDDRAVDMVLVLLDEQFLAHVRNPHDLGESGLAHRNRPRPRRVPECKRSFAQHGWNPLV